MSATLTRCVVPDALDGERLDRVLVELMPSWSRSRLAAFVRAGRVRADEQTLTKPGHPVERGQVLSVELPFFVELEISETDPGIRGDTAQGGTKPATLETGAVILVPLFVEIGDVVKVDRREDKYLTRVSG